MDVEGRAYLDIETSFSNKVTVVGIFRPDRSLFVQLVGGLATAGNLLEALNGATTIVTYNGQRFDLPVLANQLDVDMFGLFRSHDLMYDCWKKKLKGGLKAVERQLGIDRSIFGKDEDDPRTLWDRFRRHSDENSLERLLSYNREDTVNLFLLEERLFDLSPREEYLQIDLYQRLL